MKKARAIICTILLILAFWVVMYVAMRIKVQGVSIWHFITTCIAGGWTGAQIAKFYIWLRNKQ